MNNQPPDICSMFSYWSALDDFKQAFKHELLECRTHFAPDNQEAHKMWWDIINAFDRCIRGLRENADKAFREVETDIWKQSHENEIPF